jgi:general secretion pathway protein C
MQIFHKLATLGADRGSGIGPALQSHGPTIVTVVLVIALAAQLATLAWRVLAPAAPAPVAPPAVTQAGSGLNVAGIVNAHLFGTALMQASGDSGAAPTTSLNLVLAGTLAGSEPTNGWAIIGETAQNARVHAVGSTLPGGVRLREVYVDRVILDRGGRLESLPLPRLAGGAGAVPVAYTPAPASAPVSTDSGLADNIRQFVAQDPQMVAEILRPQPVFAGGQQRGYRVYPGRNRSRFASLGLMPGDLVTAVNGMPLDDPNRGLESLRGVGAGSAVTLTIERNGQTQQLTVDPSAAMAEIPAADGSPLQTAPDESE